MDIPLSRWFSGVFIPATLPKNIYIFFFPSPNRRTRISYFGKEFGLEQHFLLRAHFPCAVTQLMEKPQGQMDSFWNGNSPGGDSCSAGRWEQGKDGESKPEELRGFGSALRQHLACSSVLLKPGYSDLYLPALARFQSPVSWYFPPNKSLDSLPVPKGAN